MDNLTELERIERGRAATELLGMQLLKDAFIGVRAGILADWEGEIDPAIRDRLWAALHGARRIETWLRVIAEDGRIAQAEAERAKQG